VNTTHLTTPKQALIALVDWSLENRCCSTGETIREFLLSLYNSDYRCDLSKVHGFDNEKRRWLCRVIEGIGVSFWDYEIREMFCRRGGEEGLRWFLAPTGKLDAGLIRHFMSGAGCSV